jgi:hypothetical protein
MLIDSQEGAGEGAFQALDNVVRVTEQFGVPDLYSQFQQLPPMADSSIGVVPQATITPDGITFNASPMNSMMTGAEGALSQLMPGMDSMISSIITLPGGAGLLASFFQALGALFAGVIQSFGMTAQDLSMMYAQAAQSAMDMSKMARS